MNEVEGILNGRPLTPVSSDPKDLDPLTPNHLLLLQANPSLQQRRNVQQATLAPDSVHGQYILEALAKGVFANPTTRVEIILFVFILTYSN